MDANLCAPLLAVIELVKTQKRVRTFMEFGDIVNVFYRNGMMSHLQGLGNNNEYEDERESTIPLKKFDQADDEIFCNYVAKDFFGHRGLFKVPKKIKDALAEHYAEIFTNVGIHARTDLPVYCCGQYFPQKNVLKFTLVDLGVGFLTPIQEKTTGGIDNDNDAIIWATSDFNTTKDESLGPGGTGLKLLKEYCYKNNGSLHICSGKGFVNMLNNRALEFRMPHPFPGSIINIIIRKI
ncbi:hypothetical protein GYB22_04415 [bacterium]|nr:hypothetical protein [bacterium]